MLVSILKTLLIAYHAALVSALPQGLQFPEDLELASFTPSEPISGWPTTVMTSSSDTGTIIGGFEPWTSVQSISGWPDDGWSSTSLDTSSEISYSTSWITSTIFPLVTATTITVTDNSITWTPTASVSGWPPAASNTYTVSGEQVIETFTITFTTYSEVTIPIPLPSVTGPVAQSQTPSVTYVTVTASPTSLDFTPTGPFTVITVTASPAATAAGSAAPNGTPRFTTITVSEVTIWPVQTTTPISTQGSSLVTLTMTSSSINSALNITSISYSSTVMTLSPPPTTATGIATVGIAH